MHPILVLLRKDFALFFRDKAAVSLAFLVPFALIYVFGQVFGVNHRGSGPTGIAFAVVNQSTDPAATRIVGGWAMQFLLFALSASAGALFYEKDQGLFQRILSAPVSRAHIMWSKFLYGVCLGLSQLVVLFFAGHVLFGIDIEHRLGSLTVVCAFAAAACTSFGMLLAAVAPSAESARGLAIFLILLMSAIGGAWFPTSFMPEFIQHLSKLTLVYWSMEGFTQVLWAHASPVELLPTLAILAAMTATVLAVAIWRFNKGKIFE
jgi:ABC-2 type transport system permease protein